MRKTENKRKKVQMPAGIRQKMMAAVSMLMVSAIMMVSSTYAWFTLSTAPEVTGITTNIGANGNLEMMLLTGYLGTDGVTQEGSYYSTAEDLGVISQVGDSMAAKSATEANVTWGNLVDLSDGSYGLSGITLAPARLNVTAGAEGASDTIDGNTFLYAPSYGSDGRVIDVKTATYTGKYTDAGTYAYDENHKGVRVIGTTTDVSQRLAAYRSAKAAITTNISAAKNKATSSLVTNGQDLANIMVGYATDPEITFTYKDLRVLNNVLSALTEASSSAESAIKNAVLAYSLSSANTAELDDAAVTALTKDITSVTISSTSSFSSVTNVLEPSGLSAAITSYLELDSKLTEAASALNTLAPDLESKNDDGSYVKADTDGSFSYNDLYKILTYIVDKENVEIAGVTDPGKDDLGTIVKDYMNNQSITINMLDGSGVYADIAKLTGNYTASGFNVSITYESILGPDPVDVPVTMNAKTQATDAPQLKNIAIGSAPEDSDQAANSILSNTYGYALDFGFRTNAAASSLQLQTSAVNRVYTDEEDTSLNTQGSGSFMQFTSSDVSNFSADDVLALMSAIRVAFVTQTDSDAEILAMGALDITRTVDNTTGIATYTKGNTVEAIDAKGDTVEATAATGYKSGLFLYDYEVDKDGIITLDEKQADESAITALTQNKAMKITVIVYLDGDIVDNTMVANADTSMTGLMNIQFSSSATLSPMENTGMREGGTTGEVVTYIEKAASGATYEIAGYTGTVKDGYTIYTGSDGETYFSNNGVSYTKLTTSNYAVAIRVSITESGTDDNTTV